MLFNMQDDRMKEWPKNSFTYEKEGNYSMKLLYER